MLAFSGGDGRVRAAGPGRLYRFCGGPGSDALIEVIHPDGSATEYYQLRAETRIADGSLVAAGTYLGMTGTSMACGGTVPGPGPGRARVRPEHGRRQQDEQAGKQRRPGAVAFAVIGTGGVMNLVGLTLGGWTFHEQAKPPLVWAQRAAVRVTIGGLLMNYRAATPGRPRDRGTVTLAEPGACGGAHGGHHRLRRSPRPANRESASPALLPHVRL